MSKARNKANPNMARSKKACQKAAKARWKDYWDKQSLLEKAIAAGFCEPVED
jgi:hypothetical protein